MDFVFSREYRYRFDEIIALTGLVNVNEEKINKREKRKSELKEWWSGLFYHDEPVPEPVKVPVEETLENAE